MITLHALLLATGPTTTAPQTVTPRVAPQKGILARISSTRSLRLGARRAVMMRIRCSVGPTQAVTVRVNTAMRTAQGMAVATVLTAAGIQTCSSV